MSRTTLPILLRLLTLWLPLAVPPAGRAQAREFRYELRGQIVNEEGKSHRHAFPVVTLRGSTTPFTTTTEAGPDGKFRIKDLLAGTYTLYVHVPRAGEVEKTIEVGPAFADKSKRVQAEIVCCVGAGGAQGGIAASQLSIPPKAWEEYQRAQRSLSRRDIEAAISQLERAVSIAPQFVDAWNNLGTIAYQTQKYAEAEKYFREGLKHDMLAYSPLVNLGGALLSQGKLQEALEVNLQAVAARPEDALSQAQLGLSYYYLNRFDEAERHLKLAKTIDPAHFTHPQLVLADIYGRRLNYPALAEELEEFLRLHPDSAEAPGARRVLEKVRERLRVP